MTINVFPETLPPLPRTSGNCILFPLDREEKAGGGGGKIQQYDTLEERVYFISSTLSSLCASGQNG